MLSSFVEGPLRNRSNFYRNISLYPFKVIVLTSQSVGQTNGQTSLDQLKIT